MDFSGIKLDLSAFEPVLMGIIGLFSAFHVKLLDLFEILLQCLKIVLHNFIDFNLIC